MSFLLIAVLHFRKQISARAPNDLELSGEPSERSERPERSEGRRVRCSDVLGDDENEARPDGTEVRATALRDSPGSAISGALDGEDFTPGPHQGGRLTAGGSAARAAKPTEGC